MFQNSRFTIFNFSGPNNILSYKILDKHRTLCYFLRLYVTLINLTENGIYSSTVTKELLSSLLLTLDK